VLNCLILFYHYIIYPFLRRKGKFSNRKPYVLFLNSALSLPCQGVAKTYQLGNRGQYGVMRKLVPMTTDSVTNQLSCFEVNGTADSKVGAQSIIPNPTGFTVESPFVTLLLNWFPFLFLPYDQIFGVTRQLMQSCRGAARAWRNDRGNTTRTALYDLMFWFSDPFTSMPEGRWSMEKYARNTFWKKPKGRK